MNITNSWYIIFEFIFEMDRSNVRDSYMRSSYVFNTAGNNNANRSFISTALIGDSLAYNDDLRKYSIWNVGPVSRTCLIIRKLTSAIIFNSLWCFRPSRSKDYPTKLKYWEWSLLKLVDNSSMLRIMKCKLDN